MQKLIELIIAIAIFVGIMYFLIPMLPGALQTVISAIVVLCAIVYALMLISGSSFPWRK
jgi:hypothetical protein